MPDAPAHRHPARRILPAALDASARVAGLVVFAVLGVSARIRSRRGATESDLRPPDERSAWSPIPPETGPYESY